MSLAVFRSLTIVLLVACGGPGDGQAKGDGEGKDGEEEDPDARVLVEVAPVARAGVADTLDTTGVLESEAQADIVPEATGIVQQVMVEEGDQVRRGQVLAVLSNPSLEAGADRATTELDRARRELEQAQQLHQQGALSDQDLRNAEAALTAARTTFAEASATRGFTRLTSPIDGTVSVRDVREGELAGGRRAFQVVDLNRTRVVVQLPEKDLARVRVGQVARLQGAYDDAAVASGSVDRISPVVDPQSGTVRVTVRVDAVGTPLRPGQFVKVRLEVDRHEDVLTVPRRAVVWEDGEPLAWLVIDAPPPEPDDADKDKDADATEDGNFLTRLFGGDAPDGDPAEADDAEPKWPDRRGRKVSLTLGFVDDERAEVVAGLDEGAPVITVGHTNLREDTPLRLPEDPLPEAKKRDPDDGDADGADKGTGGAG
jgi:membrane fusion protein, multidrug efflux system